MKPPPHLCASGLQGQGRAWCRAALSQPAGTRIRPLEKEFSIRGACGGVPQLPSQHRARHGGTCRVTRRWRWVVVLPFLLLDVCAQCKLPEPYVPSRCHSQGSTTLLLLTPRARRGEGCVSGAEWGEWLVVAERTQHPRGSCRSQCRCSQGELPAPRHQAHFDSLLTAALQRADFPPNCVCLERKCVLLGRELPCCSAGPCPTWLFLRAPLCKANPALTPYESSSSLSLCCLCSAWGRVFVLLLHFLVVFPSQRSAGATRPAVMFGGV